jgi:hypothetical protein
METAYVCLCGLSDEWLFLLAAAVGAPASHKCVDGLFCLESPSEDLSPVLYVCVCSSCKGRAVSVPPAADSLLHMHRAPVNDMRECNYSSGVAVFLAPVCPCIMCVCCAPLLSIGPYRDASPSAVLSPAPAEVLCPVQHILSVCLWLCDTLSVCTCPARASGVHSMHDMPA